MFNKMIIHKYSGVIMMETELHHIKLKGNVLVLRSKNVVPNDENIMDTIHAIKEVIPTEKVHLFVDNSNGIVLNKNQRRLFIEQLEELVDVVAVKNSGWTSRLLYNLIKRFDKPKMPILLMESEDQMGQLFLKS
ncbi:MAG: hypothetical protein ABJG68_05835 [Crocinitomicaceae bacterium]